MKKIAVIFLLLASLRASGDLVIVERIDESRQQPKFMTIKIKGDKFRKDFPDQTSIIFNMATGDSIRIDHSTKSFGASSGKEAQKVITTYRDAKGSAPARPASLVKIVDTGKMEKVDGHDAEVYTVTIPAATFIYWVTKDYPDYAAVNGDFKKLQEQSEAMNRIGGLAPGSAKLDGIVIKSERLSSGGNATTITVISAKEEAIDDSEFQPPAGYKEIK